MFNGLITLFVISTHTDYFAEPMTTVAFTRPGHIILHVGRIGTAATYSNIHIGHRWDHKYNFWSKLRTASVLLMVVYTISN